MSDIGAELIGQFAAVDPRLRARVMRLAEIALDQAEFLIQHGDPKTKQQLINGFMTVFARQLREQQVNDELEEMRGALTELRTAVLQRPSLDANVLDEPDATPDAPPKPPSP